MLYQQTSGLNFMARKCVPGSIPVGGCVGDWRALFPSLDRVLFGDCGDADNGHPPIAKRPESTAMSIQRPKWLQQKVVGGLVSRKCSTASWQRRLVSKGDRLCIDSWNVNVDHHPGCGGCGCPRDGNVRGLEDLQSLLMTDGGVRFVVVLEGAGLAGC